jgi:hypothetical protein
MCGITRANSNDCTMSLLVIIGIGSNSKKGILEEEYTFIRPCHLKGDRPLDPSSLVDRGKEAIGAIKHARRPNDKKPVLLDRSSLVVGCCWCSWDWPINCDIELPGVRVAANLWERLIPILRFGDRLLPSRVGRWT